MTIRNYKELFEKNNINTSESKKLLKRFDYVKTYKKIINTILILLWLPVIFTLILYSTKEAGPFFGLAGVFTMFIYSILFMLYMHLRNKYIGKLEQIYFDEFLCKQLKIFYSTIELTGFEYKTIKEVTVTANQNYNQRQALIQICNQAYEEGAEGVLILNFDNASITTNISSKGSNYGITNLIGTTSARLISDIKEKENKKDLSYWFDLKEKGVINDEEYDKKKKELIN